MELNPSQTTNELVLSPEIICIAETNMFAIEHMYVDNYFGEEYTDASWKPTIAEVRRNAQPFPKYETSSLQYKRKPEQYWMCRRMLDQKKNLIIPICHTHPIRAELELNWYGRQMFEEKWDDIRPGVLPVVSLPHQDFIDGFGVYLNSYRSLMGFYSILAGLSESERKRPGSIFPIVLGPHASEFGDVINPLRTIEHLNRGMEMEVNGKMVRLCAYTMCYIGDIPQMAENSGLKGPRAKKFCRCCYTFSG